MVKLQDKLRPTQPFFVLDTDKFYQEIYLKQGISHFYTFKCKENTKLRVVPDGCIDLIFGYGSEQMLALVCGTATEYKVESIASVMDIFGVRFFPGVLPEILSISMKDVYNRRQSMEPFLIGDQSWLEDMSKETDFYQRIRFFLENYTMAEKKRTSLFGKKELIYSVKQMVYESCGKIKISELSDRTGYSERYINKVFIEEMGFSPKTFCKIIQFQRAIELLNYGAPENMTDAAVYLGYYDQPQFIRDFTKYANITPNKYIKMVESEEYRSKIISLAGDI